MALTLTLGTTTLSAATAANSTITKPASTVDGDLVIAHVHVEDNVTVTPPAGWNLIGSVSSPDAAMDGYAYWRVMDGDGASWTWTHASTWRSGMAYRITGAPAAAVIDGTPTTGTGVGVTVTWPSITDIAQNNSGLVAIRGSFDTKSQTTLSSPLVERLDSGWVGVASGIQAAAGASGDKTLTIAAAGTDEWYGIMFAIKDAAESPGPTAPFPPWPPRAALGRLLRM